MIMCKCVQKGRKPVTCSNLFVGNQWKNSGVQNRNSERAFNCALGFADKMFLQRPYVFY